jgi:hypothetical protein
VSLINTIHYIHWRKHKVYCEYFSYHSNVSSGFVNNIKHGGKKTCNLSKSTQQKQFCWSVGVVDVTVFF